MARVEVKLGAMPRTGDTAFLQPAVRKSSIRVGAEIVDNVNYTFLRHSDSERVKPDLDACERARTILIYGA